MVRQVAEPVGAMGIRETGQEPDATIIRALSKDMAVVDAIETRQVVNEILDDKQLNEESRENHSKVERTEDNTGIIDLTGRDDVPVVNAGNVSEQKAETPRASWLELFDWTSIGGSGGEQQRQEPKEETREAVEARETIDTTVTVETIETIEQEEGKPTVLVETIEEKEETEADVHVVTGVDEEAKEPTVPPVFHGVVPNGTEKFQRETNAPPRQFVSEECAVDSHAGTDGIKETTPRVSNAVIQPVSVAAETTASAVTLHALPKRAQKSLADEDDDIDEELKLVVEKDVAKEVIATRDENLQVDPTTQVASPVTVVLSDAPNPVSVVEPADVSAKDKVTEAALVESSDCGFFCFAAPEILTEEEDANGGCLDITPKVTLATEKETTALPGDNESIAEPEQKEDSKDTTVVALQRGFLSSMFSCMDPAPPLEKTGVFAVKYESPIEMKGNVGGDAGEGKTPPPGMSPAIQSTLTPPEPNVQLHKDDDNVKEHNDNDDEDKSMGDNLLDNRDLESIPSVVEDVEESVGPMQAEDLGPPNSPNANSATLVESKAKQLKIPDVRLVDNMSCSSTMSKNTEVSEPVKIPASSFDSKRRRLLMKELRSAIATFGRYDVRCANISAALGDLLDEASEFDRAIKYHRDAVTIYSCKLGDDHNTTLDAKVRFGAVLENAGQVEEAINSYYQVTVMRRALRGDQDPSVADGLVCMAHALRKKGDYMQAIKELKRALKVYRESLGDSDDKVASTVDEIASLYVTIGDFGKAAAILEEIVKLKAATMGSKSRAVANTLAHLATAYECSENFPAAMKALKKSYKIYTEISGYSGEDATGTLNRMAQLYESTEDHNRAAVAYLGVLRARKIHRGADHLTVGETYFRLGHALRATKQYDKALKCLKEALPIFVGQGVEMNDVEMVAEIMHEMALVNQDRRHFQDAARIFKQELNVRRKIGQPEFPFAARTLKNLGVNEFNLKNYSRSLKYLVEALTIYQDRGDQGMECGEVLFHTGLAFSKLNNTERALEAFVEAVRIFIDHGHDDDFPLLHDANERIKHIKRDPTKKKKKK